MGKKYEVEVEITETLTKIVKIVVDTAEETANGYVLDRPVATAIEIVNDKYNEGEIVLSSDDYVNTEIDAISCREVKS